MIDRRQFEATTLLTFLGSAVGFHHASEPGTTQIDHSSWPQWGGPTRNFAVLDRRVNLVEAPPKVQWSHKIGSGHSALIGDREFMYSCHLEGDREITTKWNMSNGEPIWDYACEVGYHASRSDYDGPHATPTIEGNSLVTVSIDAKVSVLDAGSGNCIWTRDLESDYEFKSPQSGYAASPLIVGHKIILPTVGRAQASETERYELSRSKSANDAGPPGCIALDIATGEKVWQTESFRSSHSSPILAEIEGQPTVVFHGMFELVGVNPLNGEVLWRHLLREEAADNVTSTPIWDSERNQVIVCHGYCRFGTQAIQVRNSGGRWSTETKWTNRDLRIVHTNAVVVDEILIGTNRSPGTLLVGIDIRDGRTRLRQRGFGKSNLLNVGPTVLILEESGVLIAGRLHDDRFLEEWRSECLSAPTRTAPSMIGDQLLVRDTRDLKVLRFE